MKERPIIFSGPMVRAILADRKTQTRRLLKKQPIDILPMSGDVLSGGWVGLEHVDVDSAKNKGRLSRCRYGVAGDRLWVRETYRLERRGKHVLLDYPADPGSPAMCDVTKRIPPRDLPRRMRERVRPAIYMYRWASRITLEVANVRVQRLQEISEEDALAEGFIRGKASGRVALHEFGLQVMGEHWPTARRAYADLWDRINGKRAPWSSNPWVWAISFRLLEVRRAA